MDSGTPVLTANPTRVQANVPTNITFTSSVTSAAGNCHLSGAGIPTQTYVPAPNCAVGPTPYTASLSLTTQTPYTLTCSGGRSVQVFINVVPQYKEF
jgi:hypothetical protein